MIALGAARLDPGLVDVMAVIAQSLPVIDVPEQHHIPPVRQSVVYQRRQQRASFAQVHAPGITRQERLGLLAPTVIVAPLVRCPTACTGHDAPAVPTRNTGCDVAAPV